MAVQDRPSCGLFGTFISKFEFPQSCSQPLSQNEATALSVAFLTIFRILRADVIIGHTCTVGILRASTIVNAFSRVMRRSLTDHEALRGQLWLNRS